MKLKDLLTFAVGMCAMAGLWVGVSLLAEVMSR